MILTSSLNYLNPGLGAAPSEVYFIPVKPPAHYDFTYYMPRGIKCKLLDVTNKTNMFRSLSITSNLLSDFFLWINHGARGTSSSMYLMGGFTVIKSF